MRALGTIDQTKPGGRVAYNDGWAVHSGIFADAHSGEFPRNDGLV